jgi:hypothetical protein
MRVLIALLFLMMACNTDNMVEMDTTVVDLVDIPNYSKIVEFYESYSASVTCTDRVTSLNVYRLRTEIDTLYVLEPVLKCTGLLVESKTQIDRFGCWTMVRLSGTNSWFQWMRRFPKAQNALSAPSRG